MMQLARAQARLVQPDRLHQLNHLLGLARSGPLSLAPLIIRLATDADKAASSLDAQSGDLTTTDSLPEDFFTVIPCSSRMISMTFSNRADFSFSSCNCFSSSLIRCSGVNGLFDVLGVAAPGLRRPRGEVQSCKPCYGTILKRSSDLEYRSVAEPACRLAHLAQLARPHAI